MYKKIFLLSVLFLLSKNIYTQSNIIDSLRIALKNAKHDSDKCGILREMISETEEVEKWIPYNRELISICKKNLEVKNNHHYLFGKYCAHALIREGGISEEQGNVESADERYNEALTISKEIENHTLSGNILNTLGALYHSTGNSHKALQYFNQALDICEKNEIELGLASTLNNIGLVYNAQGNVPRSLEYYIRSLKIREKIYQKDPTPKNKKSIANSLTNLGTIYTQQKEKEKAIEYFQKAIVYQQEAGDKKGEATSLSNLANNYDNDVDAEKIMELNLKALEIRKEIDDQEGVANSLSNIGVIYLNKDNYSKALEYFQKSMIIRTNINDKEGVANCLDNMANVYLKTQNISLAKEYALKSLILAKEIEYPSKIGEAAYTLFKIFKKENNYKSALENYELYVRMNDSLSSETNRKASIKSQLKYEYEKQAAADSVVHAKESEIKNAELAKQTAEIKAKKNQQYALFGGLGLVMVFAGFMFNRFKVTQKQKNIIEEQKHIVEEQKHLVEEKQKEILDSIHYAKRIQLAQIPSEKRVDVLLKKLRNHEGK